MKMKEIWLRGGTRSYHPLDPPMVTHPFLIRTLEVLGKIRDALKYFKIATFYQNFRPIFRNETEEGHSVQWNLGLNFIFF